MCNVVIIDINLDCLKLVEYVVFIVCVVDVCSVVFEDVIYEFGMKEGFDVGFEMFGN